LRQSKERQVQEKELNFHLFIQQGVTWIHTKKEKKTLKYSICLFERSRRVELENPHLQRHHEPRPWRLKHPRETHRQESRLLGGALREASASTAEEPRAEEHPKPWLSKKASVSSGDLRVALRFVSSYPSFYLLNLKTFISH